MEIGVELHAPTALTLGNSSQVPLDTLFAV